MYFPPPRQAITYSAQIICERLAELYGAIYATPDVVYGLTAFLQTIIEIQIKASIAVCESGDKVARKND